MYSSITTILFDVQDGLYGIIIIPEQLSFSNALFKYSFYTQMLNFSKMSLDYTENVFAIGISS